MNVTTGKYEERLPCSGTLSVTDSDWSIRYYFPGPTARHNGTFFTIPGRSVPEYITILRENWDQLEALKAAVPTGGEFSKTGKLSTSIRIGTFAAGVCLHYHYLPINTKKQLDEVIAGFEYAIQRAARVQTMLQAL